MIIFRKCLRRIINTRMGLFRFFKPAEQSAKLPSHHRLGAEHGKSLPATLITLAVGSLLLTPFLSFVSSRSLGSGSARNAIAAQYSADAGIEFGIWSLLNDSSFRSLVDNNPGTPQAWLFRDH